MGERLSVVAAMLVAVGTVGAVPVVGLAPGDAAVTDQTDSEDGTLAPGERLAGVVGVQQAEFDGELDTRAFGQRVAAAGTNESKAGVVGDEVDRLRDRLAALEGEKRSVRDAYRNGSMGEGEYRARLAKLHAETRALQRQANATERAAQELPADALEAKGVDAATIRGLRTQAANMTGPEVAAMAREIAGPNVGRGMGQGGPPDFVSNRTNGPQNGTGPPGDAGPTNGTGPSNQTGPANEAGQANQTGPMNQTGPPDDTNQSGAPADD